MDRRELLLSLFDPSGFGLEVGGSYDPLLPKSMGYNVETVDYADADGLREKYRLFPNVDCSRIEDVDYVSDGRSLADLIGHEARYDFIFASHVIEHVTDIIRFIKDCESLLKPDGVLVLAVPDKRFCFDVLMPVSTVGQALEAFHEARTRHSPGTVFDHVSLRSQKDGAEIWLEPTFDDIELRISTELSHYAFEQSRTSQEYIDVHAWQFTPSHFRYFLKKLRDMGYIRSGEISFRKNQAYQVCAHEFYVVLSSSAPKSRFSDIELLKASEAELQEIKLTRAPAGHALAPAEKDRKIESLAAQLAETQEQLARQRSDRDALLASTSWKVTAPLRYLKSAILPGKKPRS